MPKQRTLTEAQIAEAALTVLADDGLPDMSMRTVAQHLGVGAMSLYRYVDSRDALEALVVAHVFDELDTSPPKGKTWQLRATDLALRIRSVVVGHPAVVPLLVAKGHAAPAMIAWLEALLAVLRDAGFSADERVIAARTIGAHVIGAVLLSHLGPLSRRKDDFASIPERTFPLVTEASRRAASFSPEFEFERGLAAVLAGLQPLSTKTRAR